MVTMIEKYLKRNSLFVVIIFILTVIEIVINVIALEAGAKEVNYLADYFLQFGYGIFAVYLVVVKASIIVYIIGVAYSMQVYFNKISEEKGDTNSFFYGERILNGFIPLCLACLCFVTMDILWHNCLVLSTII